MWTRRLEMGLTQAQLGLRARLCDQEISEIEQGKRYPRQETKRRLMKTLHVPFSQWRTFFPRPEDPDE